MPCRSEVAEKVRKTKHRRRMGVECSVADVGLINQEGSDVARETPHQTTNGELQYEVTRMLVHEPSVPPVMNWIRAMVSM